MEAILVFAIVIIVALLGQNVAQRATIEAHAKWAEQQRDLLSLLEKIDADKKLLSEVKKLVGGQASLFDAKRAQREMDMDMDKYALSVLRRFAGKPTGDFWLSFGEHNVLWISSTGATDTGELIASGPVNITLREALVRYGGYAEAWRAHRRAQRS